RLHGDLSRVRRRPDEPPARGGAGAGGRRRQGAVRHAVLHAPEVRGPLEVRAAAAHGDPRLRSAAGTGARYRHALLQQGPRNDTHPGRRRAGRARDRGARRRGARRPRPSRRRRRDRMNEPALTLEGVSFRYGDRQALDDVSFAVQSGEIFGLLGPNGGGKTTLFRILSTSLPVQQGTANVLGHNVSTQPDALRQLIGVTFQSPSLDPKLTVGENLTYQGHLY